MRAEDKSKKISRDDDDKVREEHEKMRMEACERMQ